MNKYLSALWDLKLRVDAYNEHDPKANAAFDILKDFINEVTSKQEAATSKELEQAIEYMKKHTKVQEHPDMFFHREIPEHVLIELCYLEKDASWSKPLDEADTDENNRNYNLCKRILGLPEYKEN